MGFYTVARNKDNKEFTSVSFEVWNPNIEMLYTPLGLENPYGVQFSGNGETIAFSLEQLKKAYTYVEKQEFYSDAIHQRLHPIVLLLSGGYPMMLDPQREKERLLKFLSECLNVAMEEEEVTIYLG